MNGGVLSFVIAGAVAVILVTGLVLILCLAAWHGSRWLIEYYLGARVDAEKAEFEDQFRRHIAEEYGRPYAETLVQRLRDGGAL